MIEVKLNLFVIFSNFLDGIKFKHFLKFVLILIQFAFIRISLGLSVFNISKSLFSLTVVIQAAYRLLRGNYLQALHDLWMCKLLRTFVLAVVVDCDSDDDLVYFEIRVITCAPLKRYWLICCCFKLLFKSKLISVRVINNMLAFWNISYVVQLDGSTLELGALTHNILKASFLHMPTIF